MQKVSGILIEVIAETLRWLLLSLPIKPVDPSREFILAPTASALCRARSEASTDRSGHSNGSGFRYRDSLIGATRWL